MCPDALPLTNRRSCGTSRRTPVAATTYSLVGAALRQKTGFGCSSHSRPCGSEAWGTGISLCNRRNLWRNLSDTDPAPTQPHHHTRSHPASILPHPSPPSSCHSAGSPAWRWWRCSAGCGRGHPSPLPALPPALRGEGGGGRREPVGFDGQEGWSTCTRHQAGR